MTSDQFFLRRNTKYLKRSDVKKSGPESCVDEVVFCISSEGNYFKIIIKIPYSYRNAKSEFYRKIEIELKIGIDLKNCVVIFRDNDMESVILNIFE